MTLTAHRQIDDVDHVLVSQATRTMAKPASHEVRTFAQEYESLVQRKKDIESLLSSLNHGSLSKDRVMLLGNIHDANRHREFHNRKSEIQEERTKLIREKAGIEKRMLVIKHKAHTEMAAQKIAVNAAAAKISGLSRSQQIDTALERIEKKLDMLLLRLETEPRQP